MLVKSSLLPSKQVWCIRHTWPTRPTCLTFFVAEQAWLHVTPYSTCNTDAAGVGCKYTQSKIIHVLCASNTTLEHACTGWLPSDVLQTHLWGMRTCGMQRILPNMLHGVNNALIMLGPGTDYLEMLPAQHTWKGSILQVADDVGCAAVQPSNRHFCSVCLYSEAVSTQVANIVCVM